MITFCFLVLVLPCPRHGAQQWHKQKNNHKHKKNARFWYSYAHVSWPLPQAHKFFSVYAHACVASENGVLMWLDIQILHTLFLNYLGEFVSTSRRFFINEWIDYRAFIFFINTMYMIFAVVHLMYITIKGFNVNHVKRKVSEMPAKKSRYFTEHIKI